MDGAEPGRLVAGRYRLSRVIGRGGMGAVWQARDELLDRDVAVKELVWPPSFTERERETACRRASREAQVAARLNHPNVIRVYDIVVEDGHPWIVMELLPYQSLRDLVAEEGPLTPARAARVGLGILAALGAAHAEGIVHRDVKPANILVGPDDRVVLTDFGIARAADSTTLTTAGMLIGSPSYMAPERARGGESSAPGDLWGLGASLYAAVEGHPPFDRENALASLTAVVADEPEPAKHAGPLRPVITGLLRKDPDERLDAAETERMLHHVLAPPAPAPAPAEPTPVSAEPVPAEPVPAEPAWSRRTHRRVPALAGLAALVVTVAAAIGVAFALTSSPGRPTASPAGSTHSSPAAGSHSSAGTTPTATSRRSSAASGSGSASSGTMPAGWYRFTNSTGFSIGVPDGWQISHVGHYVYITDPDNGGIFLLIDQSDQPKPNPLADWQQQAAAREGSYPDYHQIRLESVSYPQAEAAADWEFTYDRNGVPVHILNRNILANADHAYALYWSTPESDWNAYYRYFQAFAATFRPAPA
jgi:eukaryotic-like serine/threonine-protein kinase